MWTHRRGKDEERYGWIRLGRLLYFFIPIVNFVIFIVTVLALAGNFVESGAFAVGVIFLPIIFSPFWRLETLPIEGEGDSGKTLLPSLRYLPERSDVRCPLILWER